MEPTEDEPPNTMSVLPVGGAGFSSDGYGRPRAGVRTPGMHGPGSFKLKAQTAASNAKGTTTPSVKRIVSGRIAALLAGTTEYNA